jgi:hypothetical protein
MGTHLFGCTPVCLRATSLTFLSVFINVTIVTIPRGATFPLGRDAPNSNLRSVKK